MWARRLVGGGKEFTQEFRSSAVRKESPSRGRSRSRQQEQEHEPEGRLDKK